MGFELSPQRVGDGDRVKIRGSGTEADVAQWKPGRRGPLGSMRDVNHVTRVARHV